MNAPLASVDRLRVEFPSKRGAVPGVEDVSFTIEPGETLCIVGESGSGKSVSAHALMQLTKFSGGWVPDGHLYFQGRDRAQHDLRNASEPEMRAIRGNEIGMIFQEPMTALNPTYTIGWQMAESLMLHKHMTRAEADKRSLELLRQVRMTEPEKRLEQYPHELSGGMRQRIVIAMALACEPKLLIADEPTTALDVTVQAEILALIDQLRRETGAAVLLITHDMAVVAQMADRVIVMHRGRKVEDGPVKQVLENPQHEYTKSLLAAVPSLGDMKGKPVPELAPTIGGAAAHVEKELIAGETALLKVRNLVKRFPIRGGFFNKIVANVHAVEDVSFDVNEQETVALVGESGSGKSVTGRCIIRLDEPDSGEIAFGSRDVLALPVDQMRQVRRDMQVILQDPYGSLNPQLSLLDQVAEPLRNFGLETGSAIEDRVIALFDRVRLPRQFVRRYASELSGGQRQRVANARALAPEPRFIVADEALSALDVSVQADVLNLMMELQADLGISYLFISHDMAVVERISHRVAVMHLGRIVEIGTRRQIIENPCHSYTRSLLEAVPKLDVSSRTTRQPTQAKAPPSPIHPVGFTPEPLRYEEVDAGHLVLQNRPSHVE